MKCGDSAYFSRPPKDEVDNRNATQKLKTCVDPSLVPRTPKDKLKLKDDFDVATDDPPLFTSNAQTSCSMRKTNAIRTHARTHFSHGDSNQRACLSLCVHFYQQTNRQNNK